MGRVIFLVEEPSMKALLEGLIPRLFPNLQFACIAHEGKYDLEKSIPRKLRAWREPGVSFVVVQDNDNGDCQALKDKIVQLCKDGGKDDTLVRIVCQELEAWYIGDPDAMALAFANEKLRDIGNQSRYRVPDTLPKPSEDLRRLVPGFQKSAGARSMANYLTLAGNKSTSFVAFIRGIARLYPDAYEEGSTEGVISEYLVTPSYQPSSTGLNPPIEVPQQLPLL